MVFTHAGARVVAVSVSDDRARHRLPGIDMEVARRAVQAFRAQLHEVACRSCAAIAELRALPGRNAVC